MLHSQGGVREVRLGHTELPMSVEKESILCRRESPAMGKALSQGGRGGRQVS